MRPPPDGYHREWCVDEEWKVGGDGRQCRMMGCKNTAVAALRRRHHFGPNRREGFQWWFYCGLHLYGRKIEAGVVKNERWVENSPGATP